MSTPVTDLPPSRCWIRLGVVIVFIAGIVGFFFFGGLDYLSWDPPRGRLTEFREAVDDNLPLAIAVFFLIYLGVTALSLPIASTVSLIGGAIFGRWLGTGVVLVAATCGATLAFLSSRLLFRDWVERKFGSRLKLIQDGVAREGAYYLFTLRLIPYFPFFLVNLGMGLTPIHVRTFFWVSMIGMLPGTFMIVNAGRELSEIESPGDIVSWGMLFAFALLGLVPLVLRKVLTWVRKPTHPEPEA
ncbi:MAG: TVP38/TMEM64 family protein [Gemmataceae bacterium]|nr:TVP38/TMEM64 family protein [Gemmataceae bacterium]